MHLVLGSQRHDLGRTVVIARVHRPEGPVPGADALWADQVDGVALGSFPVPVGADAAGAADVHRLADAGAAAVGLMAGDADGRAAAAERRLTVLVPFADLGAAAGSLPSERVLVSHQAPVDGGVACFSPPGDGPAAWGAATRALADGVRVLRGRDARSLRRVATVAEHLVAARQESRP
ncbi:MAG TPA: hypothetical protein VFV42_06690 [Acidimicrobiales bacterium]|nr:hypothetical protein [Acidimicrobiales bacterium]